MSRINMEAFHQAAIAAIWGDGPDNHGQAGEGECGVERCRELARMSQSNMEERLKWAEVNARQGELGRMEHWLKSALTWEGHWYWWRYMAGEISASEYERRTGDSYGLKRWGQDREEVQAAI